MRRAIVTGASEGLGLAISSLFLERGVEVIGLSRNKPTINIKHISTDLANQNSIQQAITTINQHYNEFDVLINCAGILSIQDLSGIDSGEVENLFRINLFAPMILVSGLIHLIKKSNADIVNIGSTIGYKARESQCAYTSSKWGMRGLNEYLQLELRDTQCRVIGFNPGAFKSNHVEKAIGKKIELDASMPPQSLAELVCSLLDLPKNIEVSEIVINKK